MEKLNKNSLGSKKHQEILKKRATGIDTSKHSSSYGKTYDRRTKYEKSKDKVFELGTGSPLNIDRDFNTNPYEGDDPLIVGTSRNNLPKQELELRSHDLIEEQDQEKYWKSKEDVIDPNSFEHSINEDKTLTYYQKLEYIEHETEKTLGKLYGEKIRFDEQTPAIKPRAIVNNIDVSSNNVDKLKPTSILPETVNKEANRLTLEQDGSKARRKYLNMNAQKGPTLRDQRKIR